tara:strand:- start:3934 stop:4569 length:636 start_codon:yes stop_codon:yes gene_type:complete
MSEEDMSLGVNIPFYTTQEKVNLLKRFVTKVTENVLNSKDEEDSLFKKGNINDTLDKVIERIEADRNFSQSQSEELQDTKVKLSNAIGEYLRQGQEIDDLNAAHKSEIEAMKWSFSEAALKTWPYNENDSGHSPAPIRPAPTPSEETEAPTCVICLEKPPIMACVPCGHKCLCKDCATEEIKICPMCRAPITGYLRIFEKKMPAPANPFFI